MIKSAKTKTKKQELESQLEKFKADVKKTFTKSFYEDGCIGSIAELYDTKKPHAPKGTIAQAWSIAEIFRIIF